MEPYHTPRPAGFRLESRAFEDGRRLATRYTQDGSNVSPALGWSNLPQKTTTMALLCEDPDAPEDEPWVHWLIYNIPRGRLALPEAISSAEEPKEVAGALQGTNSFGTIGYDGPSPPVGNGTHHYRFTLFAVDCVLDLPPRAKKEALVRALRGHILESAERTGTYSR